MELFDQKKSLHRPLSPRKKMFDLKVVGVVAVVAAVSEWKCDVSNIICLTACVFGLENGGGTGVQLTGRAAAWFEREVQLQHSYEVRALNKTATELEQKGI